MDDIPKFTYSLSHHNRLEAAKRAFGFACALKSSQSTPQNWLSRKVYILKKTASAFFNQGTAFSVTAQELQLATSLLERKASVVTYVNKLLPRNNNSHEIETISWRDISAIRSRLSEQIGQKYQSKYPGLHAESPSDALQKGVLTELREEPPSVEPKKAEAKVNDKLKKAFREELTRELYSQWSSVDKNHLSQHNKELETVCSAPMIALTKLVEEGCTISSCSLPKAVVVDNEHGNFQQLVTEMIGTLKIQKPEIIKEMERCISLFKKPVLLRVMPANRHELPEDNDAFFINPHTYCVPKILAGGVTGSGMSTIYIDQQCKPEDLEKALQAAMSNADANLAGKSRQAIHKHLL